MSLQKFIFLSDIQGPGEVLRCFLQIISNQYIGNTQRQITFLKRMKGALQICHSLPGIIMMMFSIHFDIHLCFGYRYIDGLISIEFFQVGWYPSFA